MFWGVLKGRWEDGKEDKYKTKVRKEKVEVENKKSTARLVGGGQAGSG
jgi:hypothetical protein